MALSTFRCYTSLYVSRHQPAVMVCQQKSQAVQILPIFCCFHSNNATLPPIYGWPTVAGFMEKTIKTCYTYIDTHIDTYVCMFCLAYPRQLCRMHFHRLPIFVCNLFSVHHSSIYTYQRLQITILLSNHLDSPCIFPLVKQTNTYIHRRALQLI